MSVWNGNVLMVPVTRHLTGSTVTVAASRALGRTVVTISPYHPNVFFHTNGNRMNDRQTCWLSAVDEMKVAADDLINRAHSLLFSARMIMGIMAMKAGAAPSTKEESLKGLRIKPLTPTESEALARDLQHSLSLVSAEIKVFIPEAERVVESISAQPSEIHSDNGAKPLMERQLALMQRLAVLEGLVARD